MRPEEGSGDAAFGMLALVEELEATRYSDPEWDIWLATTDRHLRSGCSGGGPSGR